MSTARCDLWSENHRKTGRTCDSGLGGDTGGRHVPHGQVSPNSGSQIHLLHPIRAEGQGSGRSSQAQGLPHQLREGSVSWPPRRSSSARPGSPADLLRPLPPEPRGCCSETSAGGRRGLSGSSRDTRPRVCPQPETHALLHLVQAKPPALRAFHDFPCHGSQVSTSQDSTGRECVLQEGRG